LLTFEELLPAPGVLQLFLYADLMLQLGQPGQDVGLALERTTPG